MYSLLVLALFHFMCWTLNNKIHNIMSHEPLKVIWFNVAIVFICVRCAGLSFIPKIKANSRKTWTTKCWEDRTLPIPKSSIHVHYRMILVMKRLTHSIHHSPGQRCKSPVAQNSWTNPKCNALFFYDKNVICFSFIFSCVIH